LTFLSALIIQSTSKEYFIAYVWKCDQMRESHMVRSKFLVASVFKEEAKMYDFSNVF
jgi:tRNA splicing endonuclease